MIERKKFNDSIRVNKNVKRIITIDVLNQISKKVEREYKEQFGNKEININLKDIFLRCKKNTDKGNKYILKPRQEQDYNPAKIKPIEEIALKQLLEENGREVEATILLDKQKVNLSWNNRYEEDETIEIAFEKLRDLSNRKIDMELDF